MRCGGFELGVVIYSGLTLLMFGRRDCEVDVVSLVVRRGLSCPAEIPIAPLEL